MKPLMLLFVIGCATSGYHPYDEPSAVSLITVNNLRSEDAAIYLNGVLAAKAPGYISDYDEMEILPAGKAALKPGKNVLAVHCHQTGGGQYVDVGLVTVSEAGQ